MENGNVVSIEDRIPKLKEQRRKKANRRLIFILLLFFLLIVVVIYFQSPLSHIKKIEVSGNEVYSDEQIIVVSEVSLNTNIWKVDKGSIEGKVMELPQVNEVEVTVQWPNTVVIHTNEFSRIAYIMDGESFLPVLENGKILSDIGANEVPTNAPILFGFMENDVLDLMIGELEKLPEAVQNSISEIYSQPKETDKYFISLYMNDGYEVHATIRTFAEKMEHYPSIVSQLDPAQKGIINFEVGSYFRAYDADEEIEIEGEGNVEEDEE